MSCIFKNECPSYSNECEWSKQDFSRCIPFFVKAIRSRDEKIRQLRSMLNEKSNK